VRATIDDSVRSADGTSIGYRRIGSGPTIVVVHGALTTGEQWLQLADALADRFSCILMDRRGRGRSGDSVRYSISKECDDIEAILKLAGPSAALLGHSYGALCTLEAARRLPVVNLVVYEPPLPIRGSVIGPAFGEMRVAVKAERLEEGLSIGLTGLVKMSAEELAGLQASPQWPLMVALTPTWLRECEVLDKIEHGVARYSRIASPTLLALGTATAQHHVDATRALESALPNARVVELRDQGHFAHLTATAEFAAAITEFLSDS
jgi:pimeloyl-ACP methyl ester carboxylesterase